MNKEMMKKAVVEKVVDMAVQSTLETPSCWILFGKPKTKFEITVDDYAALAAFMKRSQS